MRDNPIPYLVWFGYGEEIEKKIHKSDWDDIPQIIEQMFCEEEKGG